MAEIQTYAVGAPAPTDYVPYIEDPTGTPVLKNSLVADVAGWTVIGADDLTALTAWTNVAGTWTVVSGQVTMTANTGAYSYLRSAVVPDRSVLRASVDFQAGFWGSDTRVGIVMAADAATGNQPLGYYARISGVDKLRLERHNNTTVVDKTMTTPLAAGVWHRLSVDMAGPCLAARVGDTGAMMRDDNGMANAIAPRFYLLGLSDVDIAFRNFTVEGQ